MVTLEKSISQTSLSVMVYFITESAKIGAGQQGLIVFYDAVIYLAPMA